MVLSLHPSLLVPPTVQAFTGALDGYTTNLVALYGTVKMLSSYAGSAIKVRRSSDSTLQDIGFNADGSFDATSYLAFIGGGNGFAHTVYDQSGNGRNQVQSTAAAQPQIGVDGNGQYYLYAPGAGSATTNMTLSGLSISSSEFTLWSVAGASGVWIVPLCLRDNGALKERAMLNYGNSTIAHIQDNATGTLPTTISQTTNLVYSSVLSAGTSGGSKLTNRLSTTTGTRNSSTITISEISIGRVAGGAAWLQNAPFYMGAVWNVDQSTTNFNAFATLGKTLILAAQ